MEQLFAKFDGYLQARGRPLCKRQIKANKIRSSVRARVEHVFGRQASAMPASLCAASPGTREDEDRVQNLVYNMTRFGYLERSQPSLS